MQTFRALSALLCYPEADLLDAISEISAALEAESLIPPATLHPLQHFLAEFSATPLLDAQEAYVALFDRNRSLSLHLYEHIHGDSRERGEAMVRLATLYKLHNLEVTAKELPDYVPLYLEFLSLLPDRAARSLLAEAAHVIAAIAEKLESRRSGYATVLRAIESLAARTPQPHAIADVRDNLAAEADGLTALDAQWEEETVRFAAAGGPQQATAPACGM